MANAASGDEVAFAEGTSDSVAAVDIRIQMLDEAYVSLDKCGKKR